MILFWWGVCIFLVCVIVSMSTEKVKTVLREKKKNKALDSQPTPPAKELDWWQTPWPTKYSASIKALESDKTLWPSHWDRSIAAALLKAEKDWHEENKHREFCGCGLTSCERDNPSALREQIATATTETKFTLGELPYNKGGYMPDKSSCVITDVQFKSGVMKDVYFTITNNRGGILNVMSTDIGFIIVATRKQFGPVENEKEFRMMLENSQLEKVNNSAWSNRYARQYQVNHP